MNRDELRSGAAAGVLAAAASAGTLVAIGRRTGTASRPFNVIASHLLGPKAAGAFGFVAAITLTGIVLHVILTTAIVIVILGVVRRRLAPLWLASIAASALCCLVSVGIARRGHPGLADLFSIGDLLVYYAVLAASLVAGIRFAPSKIGHELSDTSINM